ncbi:MAG: energy-coupled thiamine transporter ThiT [Bacilli bacterium]|nr:energy-coupled thiamine transporter ThiT [Bacilli bacterium]
MGENKKKIDWGFLIGALAYVAGLAFLFAPLYVYETKVVIDGVKVKTKFNLNLIGLFGDKMPNSAAVIVLLVLLGLGAALFLLGKILKKGKDGLLVGSAFAGLFSIIVMFFEREIFNDLAPKVIEHYNGIEMGWGSSVFFVMVGVAVICAISSTSYSQENDIRALAEDGILVAAAFALNFIKIPVSGSGSINLQMLPLMIIALRRGPVHGLIGGGIVYGLLTCITDGYGMSTFPYDYFIGFGSVFFMGFFRKWILPTDQSGYNVRAIILIIVTGAVSTFIRFVGGCTSSMVLYKYTLEAAMAYNAIYIPVSGAAAVVVLCFLQGPLAAISRRFPAKKAA